MILKGSDTVPYFVGPMIIRRHKLNGNILVLTVAIQRLRLLVIHTRELELLDIHTARR